MASSISLPTPQTPLLKSTFLGQNRRRFLLHRPFPLPHRASPTHHAFRPSAAFDLAQLLGGRGLCNGERGLKEELKRNVEDNPVADGGEIPETSEKLAVDRVPEDGFEKELMGLTGGFPGGEKGLRKFISENPPPPPRPKPSASNSSEIGAILSSQKPKPPDLPLLLPGMIAIVKNPNNPYYMYCGIVQRITDGKAGVLFEGGNWDRLITFRLEELERREKGPPMKNPRSAVLEPLLQNDSQ
ncbi:NAD(P)H-quinone oxidoreductase subunit S, chloroplastic [Benincasa hispida]|uniref:NAD(P)H-quinone oxidoreductase subunit S, chloroplastic n=1 Tax=Benincasa hispida TaxID=102211 RepID=UPI0019022AF2|nr:NAD(P)H-quinone oxidoreductase subunit S, chloroplastic [Benincasa hispida]XP_038902587.1 NAD(P)H-quinone oxidoreductase subunit S, chloroplastic [Benincasa hispida]XP_038902595.1 NAD(P)H-quinone oxidoreductase subunit S, chloroplastic [Benincasa hispida]XP_038902601.1 NAD(P)H-quinone oxidoreductase subunit S, chloroplastic [Benincasa hispida]XP_038902605.1 NAD(P)H-quinone oxidoreductase subunit S, chloroplastic [Benincasa hispida]